MICVCFGILRLNPQDFKFLSDRDRSDVNLLQDVEICRPRQMLHFVEIWGLSNFPEFPRISDFFSDKSFQIYIIFKESDFLSIEHTFVCVRSLSSNPLRYLFSVCVAGGGISTLTVH